MKALTIVLAALATLSFAGMASACPSHEQHVEVVKPKVGA